MKKKKPFWLRMTKWCLFTLLSLIVIILAGSAFVINFIFTPSKLTPLIEKTAAEYLTAEVHFGEVELTFFSTFPDFGLKMTDGVVVSNVFRDSVGPAVARDSLMNIKSCLVTINPMAYLLKNRIIIKDFVIDQPEIYAYIDSVGVPNWDIVRLADTTVTDTVTADTSAFASGIRIKNVRIRNGKLIFDDRSTQLYTRLTGLNLGVDGYLGLRRSKLKVNFSTENILFWQEGKLLVNHLALGVETGMKVNRDSLLYTLEKAVFDVNGVKFGVGGTLKADTINRTLGVNLKYGIHIPSLKTLLDLVPDTILRKTDNVDVKGEVMCRGEIKGLYGKKNIPLLTAEFKINNGYIKYPGMPSQIDTLNMEFNALVDLQKEQVSYLQMKNFCMKGGGMDIDVTGDVENLLEAPVVKSKIEALIDFAALTKIFPLADGITCAGNINMSVETDILVSDVMDANYGKLKLGGSCQMKNVDIFIPKDSIVLNVKNAGIVFSTNRRNTKTLQKTDLLNALVGYSGLDVNVKGRLHLKMDTTYLSLTTSPLKDTSAIASVSSTLHLGKMVLVVRDTLLVGLKSAHINAGLSPSQRDKKTPKINAHVKVDSLRLRMLGNRLSMAEADIQIEAERSKRNANIWRPTGYIDFRGLRAYTPYFPLRMRMPGTRVRFDRDEIELDSATLQLGNSNVRLSGSVSNLAKFFFKKEEVKAQLIVKSSMIDCNQLMKALELGTAYTAKVEAGFRETITNEEEDLDRVPVLSDSVTYAGDNSIFVVPAGVDFTFQTDIDKMLFGKLQIDSIHGEVTMRNQCIRLEDLELRSSAANMSTSALYKASDSTKAYTGFALQMHEIRIDSLVHLIPSLDTLFPMLRSFEGLVDFHIAADAWLDSTMTIDLPTLRAAAFLDGKNLVLMDGETFSEISKMLMFKNKKRNMIDSISVDFTVKDGTIEIFPFMIEIDRYKAAVGGQHNIDMTFKYHISLLKSPLPFRAGVDISGSLDKMKYKITKAKYKDIFMPSRKTQVDSTQLNLKKKMRDMLKAER